MWLHVDHASTWRYKLVPYAREKKYSEAYRGGVRPEGFAGDGKRQDEFHPRVVLHTREYNVVAAGQHTG